MTRIVPVCSGKGGVGKSLILSNLGYSLSRSGKTVVLMDMDLGGANLHTFLGIRNNQDGMGSYFHKRDIPLESIVHPTEIKKLFFIPGDSLLPDTANHPYYMKMRLQQEIQNLTADYLLIDLGAGTSYNTLDYMLLSLQPLIVINPEPTSLLNAYSLIKNAFFRLLYRQLPGRSPERNEFHRLSGIKMEGKEWNLETLKGEFFKSFPQFESIFQSLTEEFYPQIIINMGQGKQDVQYTSPLRNMCKKNLSLDIRFLGFIHYEPQIHRSVQNRKIFCMENPSSPFSEDIERLNQALQANWSQSNEKRDQDWISFRE